MLNSPDLLPVLQTAERELTTDAIRTVLQEIREEHKIGSPVPGTREIIAMVSQQVEQWLKPSLLPVINASGVILHTNLGRAPLSRQAQDAIRETAACYNTLEYDLEKGERGSRLVHAESLLKRLTGAEAALVVNNNAAAVLLALSVLANRKKVAIARSQLVEIGGGFRIPDVMRQSGAKLMEVGTTNRVHIQDYEEALIQSASLVLHAHHSNYKIIGFTQEPELHELGELARRFGVPLMDDLGSGALLDTARYGLAHEPTVQDALQAGADVVCFSGDKLLGGPQAGIILGRKALIAKMKKHPLARAIRADKLCLAGLMATLFHYLKGEAESEIPIWRMISQKSEDVADRVAHWRDVLGAGEVIACAETIGGGSMPGETLPGYGLALTLGNPNRVLKQLRAMTPPVIARIEDDKVILDGRTVLPDEEALLLKNLKEFQEKHP